jgi:3-methyl-2-oxobutanoate hydroxymethyltransferase
MVNLTFGPAAKFVRRYGDAAALITRSLLAFKADVVSHQFPNDGESYHLPRETQAALETVLNRKQSLRR